MTRLNKTRIFIAIWTVFMVLLILFWRPRPQALKLNVTIPASAGHPEY